MPELDSIWAELQAGEKSAKKNYADKLTSRTVLPNFNKPVKGKKDKKDKKGKKEKVQKKEALEFRIPGEKKSKKSSAKPSTELVVANHKPFESADDLVRECQRDLNCVGDQGGCIARVRKAAIEKLYNCLFVLEQDNAVLKEAFSSIYKTLLKLFTDPVEVVRERAVRMVIGFMKVQGDMGIFMPYLYPVLMSRTSCTLGYDYEANVFFKDTDDHIAEKLGRVKEKNKYSHKVVEPSEEVRLLLCQLLGTMLERCIQNNAAAQMQPYFHETVVFIQAQVNDPFPDLKVEGSRLLVLLSRHFSSGTKHFAIGLVKAIMPSLDHRHAKVRIAVLQAVWELVKCPKPEKCKGAATEAIVDLIGHRDDNVLPVAAFYVSDTTINYFAKFSIDSNAAVRMVFYSMIGDWFVGLPDRFDYFSRLLPYILSGVTDDCAEINALCMRNLEAIGKEHESENQKDIIERRQFGVDGSKYINLDKPLPPPFTCRPRLGMRLFVRGHTRRFVNPLTQELTSWISKTRVKAAVMFRTIVCFMEEHITVDAHKVIKTLCSTVFDDEIGELMQGICEIIGRYVDPECYVPLLIPMLSGDLTVNPNPTSANRAASLTVLARMMEGSKPSRIVPHLEVLSSNLTDEEIATSESLQLKRALADAIVALADSLRAQGKGGAVEAHFRETGRLKSMEPMFAGLLRSLLQLKRSPELHETVARGVRSLAAAEGLGGKSKGAEEQEADEAAVERLYSAHFEPLLNTAIEDFPFSGLWTAQCAEQLVIDELVSHITVGDAADSGAVVRTQQHLHSVCAFLSDIACADFGQANEGAKDVAARLHNAQLLLQRPSLADSWRGSGHTPTLLTGCLLLSCWSMSSELAAVRLSCLQTILLGSDAEGSSPLVTSEEICTELKALSRIMVAHLDGTAVDEAMLAEIECEDAAVSIGTGARIDQATQRVIAVELCAPLLEAAKSAQSAGEIKAMPSAVKPVYHALLRRLDDSHDQVRMVTIGVLELLLPMLPVSAEEASTDVIEVSGRGVTVDLDAQPAEPEYAHFLEKCLVQLRVGEEAESREFKDAIAYFLQMVATVDLKIFVQQVKKQNKHLRTNAYEDLIDHAGFIASLKSGK
jgi:nitrogen regulatory protein PII